MCREYMEKTTVQHWHSKEFPARYQDIRPGGVADSPGGNCVRALLRLFCRGEDRNPEAFMEGFSGVAGFLRQTGC